MKIERISDNQIRCTLNKEDLEGKETLLSELAFGSEKAKGLFRELMNKAATELGFETSEDNPLMVEAIPVSKECLILVITRVDNPEDFREHYKKLPKSLLAGQLAGADEDILSNLPDLLSDFGKSAFSADSGNDMKRVLADDGVGIFAFTSLDDVAFASKLLNKYSLSSTLYKDSENQCYYLSLTDLDDSPNSTVMDEIHQLLSEYCKRLPNTYATKALFNEHLTTIIENRPLKKWLLIKTNEKESPNILCSGIPFSILYIHGFLLDLFCCFINFY